MAALGPNPAKWNRTQRELRRRLESGDDFDAAITLFLRQHAQLHTLSMAGTENWSYEDETLDDMSAEAFAAIPPKGEHSLAWNFWHIARVEDITMNLLLAGRDQVLHAGGWLPRLGSPIEHTGNEMNPDEISALSAALDMEALRAYRKAVGQSTRAAVADLKPEDLGRKTPKERIERVWVKKAVLPAAGSIVDYWSRRTVTGLLLMPPTRHLFTHLNEAAEIKNHLG